MKPIKLICSLFLVWVLNACQSSVDVKAINQHINGYWEIEKAILPDGTEKDYSINATIDYFELKENQTGLRYKVVPQFSGEFLTNDRPETFTFEEKEDGIWLEYKTDFSSWKEQIVSLSEEKMVMENENKIKYYYKRAHPIQIKE